MAATGMVKDEHRPETLTRSELEAFRGPLGNGNGAGDLAVPVPGGHRPVSTTSGVSPETAGGVITPSGESHDSPAAVDKPRACVECGGALSGRQERFCSTRCRKRDQHRRLSGRQAPVRHGEPLNGAAVGDDTSRGPAETRVLPAPLPGGPFETLAALSSLLPAGWELRATASAVTVTWLR
jgi:hypothetical protein